MEFGTVDKIYLVFSKPFWAGANWGGISFLTKSANASSDWTTRILGFYTVRNQPNLLEGWITGAPARTSESLTDAVVLQKCTTLLQGAITAGTDFTFTSPVGLIRSQWASNPYFLGSYSYPSVQSNALGISQADLASPVKDSKGVTRLLFAGEATNSIHYQTVHGAVESGWREADRIVQLVG
jgi:monoamine oxidase